MKTTKNTPTNPAPHEAPTQAAVDPNHGMGGSYEMIDGVRVLRHRLVDPHVQLHPLREGAQADVTDSEGGPGPGAELKAAPDGVAPAPLEVLAEPGTK